MRHKSVSIPMKIYMTLHHGIKHSEEIFFNILSFTIILKILSQKGHKLLRHNAVYSSWLRFYVILWISERFFELPQDKILMRLSGAKYSLPLIFSDSDFPLEYRLVTILARGGPVLFYVLRCAISSNFQINTHDFSMTSISRDARFAP